MYSNGLHQGVSGIEEGDRTLAQERSFKTTWSLDWNNKKKIFFQALAYFQYIEDYIYLKPQREFRLTIRGAFPVFRYEQTNANIYGLDLVAFFQPTENIRLSTKYAFLKGQDTSNDRPLINMPTNNFSGTVSYEFNNWGPFTSCNVKVTNRYVFEQKNLEADQDFIAPPKSYYLLGLEISANKDSNKTRLKIFGRAENVFNTSYRDYLDRQRYFANASGRNFVLGANIKF